METAKLTYGVLWRLGVFYIVFLFFANGILAIAESNPRIYTSSFIILKPTLASGALALLFSVVRLFFNRSLIQLIFGYRLPFQANWWKKFDLGMIVFLLMLGSINFLVGITSSITTWVNYKFYGQMILTVSAIFILTFWIASDDHKSRSAVHQDSAQ